MKYKTKEEEFMWDFKESFSDEDEAQREEYKLNKIGIVTSIEFDGKRYNLYTLHEEKRKRKVLNTVKTGRY